MDTLIRRLTPDDAQIYRYIRLEALNYASEAFGSSYAIEFQQGRQFFAQRLQSAVILGAFHGDDLVGVIGYRRMMQPKFQHKGAVFGLYVRPEARRQGVAKALLLRAIEIARSQVEVLQTAILAEDESLGRQLDELGFEVYGTEHKAVFVGDRYLDHELRVKLLDGVKVQGSKTH